MNLHEIYARKNGMRIIIDSITECYRFALVTSAIGRQQILLERLFLGRKAVVALNVWKWVVSGTATSAYLMSAFAPKADVKVSPRFCGFLHLRVLAGIQRLNQIVIVPLRPG